MHFLLDCTKLEELVLKIPILNHKWEHKQSVWNGTEEGTDPYMYYSANSNFTTKTANTEETGLPSGTTNYLTRQGTYFRLVQVTIYAFLYWF